MRQMVFNHASIVNSDLGHASDWLKDMAQGMRELIATGVSSLNQGLRMSDQGSAAFYSMLYGESDPSRKNETREEIEFLGALAAMVPLLKDADDDLKDRLSRCQEKSLSPEDGNPLLFCVFTEGIAVGFPSDRIWDCDQVTVRFDELLAEDAIEESCETIDNLTRSIHATLIHERHIADQRQETSPDAFWDAREEVFHNLKFIPEVGGQLTNLNSPAWTKVTKALNRMEIGNLSNVKGVGEGLLEFRIHFGPGYRIYFGDDGGMLVILRCGTKPSQNQDIIEARRLWQQFKGG